MALKSLPAICCVEISERQTASAKPINKKIKVMEVGYFSTL